MEITYRENTPVTVEQVIELYRSAGLRRPIDDKPRLQTMLDNANLTLTAWDSDRLIGVARALTDFAYCCYLSDLAVHADYQRQGIGKELVYRMKARLGDRVMLLLLHAPAAAGYYPRIGFTKVENGWILPRKDT